MRQHVANFLETQLHVPKSAIATEVNHKYASVNKRSDILVMRRGTDPWMIVECKAPTVKLTDETMNQTLAYYALAPSPYVLLSNGHDHYCYAINPEIKKFVELKEFPAFE